MKFFWFFKKDGGGFCVVYIEMPILHNSGNLPDQAEVGCFSLQKDLF